MGVIVKPTEEPLPIGSGVLETARYFVEGVFLLQPVRGLQAWRSERWSQVNISDIESIPPVTGWRQVYNSRSIVLTNYSSIQLCVRSALPPEG